MIRVTGEARLKMEMMETGKIERYSRRTKSAGKGRRVKVKCGRFGYGTARW